MKKKWLIDRRSFLQGSINSSLAVGLGLPMLEMMFKSDTAFAQALESDMRFLHCYLDLGPMKEEVTIVNGNTVRRGLFEFPVGALPSDLGSIVGALGQERENFSHFSTHMQTMTYKELTSESRHQTGAGDHISSPVHTLTGAPPKKMSANHARESINNTIGRFLKSKGVIGANDFDTLQTCLVTGTGGSQNGQDGTYATSTSWKQDGHPDERIFEPLHVLNQLSLSSATQCQNLVTASLRQKSSLDFVKERLNLYMSQAGQRDREVIQNYLQAYRELEQKVNKTEEVCTPVENIPTVTTTYGQTRIENSTTNPTSFEEKRRLMAEVMAFGLSSNRIRTMATMISGENYWYPVDRLIPKNFFNNLTVPSADMHVTIGHYPDAQGTYDGVNLLHRDIHIAFNRWQMLYPLEIIRALKKYNVLDNTIFMFGYGLKDSYTHGSQYHDTFIAGGKNLGVRLGQRLNLTNVDHKKILRAILKKSGLASNQFPEGVTQQISDWSGISLFENLSDEEVYKRLFQF